MPRLWTLSLQYKPGSAPRAARCTFLAVRLPVLHVEKAVSKRFPAGGAHEAGGVPRLPQGVHHFLQQHVVIISLRKHQRQQTAEEILTKASETQKSEK